MSRLLVVHHTVSPPTQLLLDEVLAGARDPEITDVDVEVRPALAATALDVLQADGFVLGTTANIGYMSGALKHFFDQIYYPCLEATTGRPYGLYVHGNDNTAGAVRAVTSIAGGLGWQLATPVVEVTGPPQRSDREACRNLGGLLAVSL